MGLKPDYKQTEVGVIPDDWEVKKLGFLADVKTGPFGAQLHESDYVQEGTPIITVEHLGEFGVDCKNIPPMVSDIDKERLKQYILNIGDIVFSRVGSIDRNALIKNPENGWLFSGRLLRVRPIKTVKPAFLSYYFNTEEFKQRIISVAVGQTMASLNTSILKNALVVIPSFLEQQAIATTLSDMDALISSLDALLAKKRDIKQAAMQQLLTGKTRLPGFSGEWGIKKLGDLTDFFKGKGLPKSDITTNGKYKCIHYGELFTIYDAEIKEIISYTSKKGELFLSHSNDVLMPTSDVTPNGLATASCVKEGGIILGGDILVIRSFEGCLDGVFLSYGIRQNKKQIMKLVSGSTVYHLYGSDMKKYEFSVPPTIEEQCAVATILSDMDAEIAIVEQKRNKTRALKQGMMQELLTGKTRLL